MADDDRLLLGRNGLKGSQLARYAVLTRLKTWRQGCIHNSPSPLGYERVRESKTLIVVCLIVKIDDECCPLFF